MAKIDETVKTETIHIALWVLVFSTVMQAVFLVIGKWDYTVLLGNLLSGAVAVVNFLLLGLTVQNAVKKDEKEAKNLIKLSHTYRTLLLVVTAVLGALLPCFNIWASLIPFLFPRIAIIFRARSDKE